MYLCMFGRFSSIASSAVSLFQPRSARLSLQRGSRNSRRLASWRSTWRKNERRMSGKSANFYQHLVETDSNKMYIMLNFLCARNLKETQWTPYHLQVQWCDWSKSFRGALSVSFFWLQILCKDLRDGLFKCNAMPPLLSHSCAVTELHSYHKIWFNLTKHSTGHLGVRKGTAMQLLLSKHMLTLETHVNGNFRYEIG